MAIEPLSSAMTYQAQTTQQAKPVQKTVVEDTEVIGKIYDAIKEKGTDNIKETYEKYKIRET